MDKVRTGISLIYWGIVLVFVAVISLVIAAVAQVGALAIVGGVSALVAMILMLIGRVMCLGAPQETGAKEYIMVAVFLEAISILISIAQFVVPEKITPTILTVGNLMALVASVLFVLFLKQLSLYIRRDDLAQKAASLLTLGIAMIVIWLLMIGMVLVLENAMIAGILGLVVFVIAIVTLVRYVGLIAGLKTALSNPN